MQGWATGRSRAQEPGPTSHARARRFETSRAHSRVAARRFGCGGCRGSVAADGLSGVRWLWCGGVCAPFCATGSWSLGVFVALTCARSGMGPRRGVVMCARVTLRSTAVMAAVVVWLGLSAGGAGAAVTPGWECIPTTAGQAVVSGGAGSAPLCGAGTTSVLAPTYVSSGVGGKPTVEFSAVNVQVIDGTGLTSKVNGTGNLVVGYAENPSARAR